MKGKKRRVLQRLTKIKDPYKGATRGTHLLRPSHYAIVAYDGGRIKEEQLTAAFNVLKRRLKRKGVLYWRLPPLVPLTQKPLEVRMGKGKGSHEGNCVRVRPGQVIFEIGQLSLVEVFRYCEEAACKLPNRTILLTSSGRRWL